METDRGDETKDNAVRPTIAPPTVALGALLLMWGVQLGWLVVIAGAIVVALGLSRWLREVKLQWTSRP